MMAALGNKYTVPASWNPELWHLSWLQSEEVGREEKKISSHQRISLRLLPIPTVTEKVFSVFHREVQLVFLNPSLSDQAGSEGWLTFVGPLLREPSLGIKSEVAPPAATLSSTLLSYIFFIAIPEIILFTQFFNWLKSYPSPRNLTSMRTDLVSLSQGQIWSSQNNAWNIASAQKILLTDWMNNIAKCIIMSIPNLEIFSQERNSTCLLEGG